MQEATALETAPANTTRTVAGIGADQWDNATSCPKWNVREMVQHTVGVMANFAGGAAGTGVVGDPSEFDLGDDPAATCAAVAEDCVTAWRGRGELDSMISLGDNEFPGMVGISINMLDGYVHGWDIAQATGQAHQLDPAICEGLLGFARNAIPEAPRDGDNFHAVVPTPEDAGAVSDLLGYLGRRP